MCYHILYRRSDLGVVYRNPEFGYGRRQSLVFRCGAFLYPWDRSELRRSRGKSEYSLFNSIQLSFFQYACHSTYFRSDLTSKVSHPLRWIKKYRTDVRTKNTSVRLLIIKRNKPPKCKKLKRDSVTAPKNRLSNPVSFFGNSYHTSWNYHKNMI